MDIERAKEILTALADGINPVTGEILPEGDSCNQVEVVRALNTVLRTLDKKPKQSSRTAPENAGKPWSTEDENMLCQMFDDGCTRAEMSSHFKRTTGSITSRLVKLGKIVE